MSASGRSSLNSTQAPAPSRRYSHTPRVSSIAITAIPSGSPSTSLIGSPETPLARISETSGAEGDVSSSGIEVRIKSSVVIKTGASLSAFTVMEAVSVAKEKAVVPPLLEASAVVPLVPVDWSQARKVMPGLTAPL